MELSGLHILLTYQCTHECEHCFVWGSPQQKGTFTFEQIEHVLLQAKEAEVNSIYFEGGEPFLYYPILKKSVRKAAEMGFSVGIVTNAYWADSVADAGEWLSPFVGWVDEFTVSSDSYHVNIHPQFAIDAAKRLDFSTNVIRIAQPNLPPAGDEGTLMFRGRAAKKLAGQAPQHPWERFDSCPQEDLREPGRVHLDPLGNVHICQGIIIGNVFENSLKEICESYAADVHPICGSLLSGGPAALVKKYDLPHASHYADACHLCYEARLSLRERFPKILGPDQMYGVLE